MARPHIKDTYEKRAKQQAEAENFVNGYSISLFQGRKEQIKAVEANDNTGFTPKKPAPAPAAPVKLLRMTSFKNGGTVAIETAK